jgi:hypothetical protein
MASIIKCFGIICCVCVAAQEKLRGHSGKVVEAKTSWQPDFVVGEHGKITLTDDAAVLAAEIKITDGADTGSQMASVTHDHAEVQQASASPTIVAAMSIAGGLVALLVFAIALAVMRRANRGRSATTAVVDPPRTPAAMGADDTEQEEERTVISRKVTTGQWLTEFDDPVAMM